MRCLYTTFLISVYSIAPVSVGSCLPYSAPAFRIYREVCGVLIRRRTPRFRYTCPQSPDVIIAAICLSSFGAALYLLSLSPAPSMSANVTYPGICGFLADSFLSPWLLISLPGVHRTMISVRRLSPCSFLCPVLPAIWPFSSARHYIMRATHASFIAPHYFAPMMVLYFFLSPDHAAHKSRLRAPVTSLTYGTGFLLVPYCAVLLSALRDAPRFRVEVLPRSHSLRQFRPFFLLRRF